MTPPGHSRMMSFENELLLRAHIRELLSEYVYTHIAFDHEEYTQAAVSDLLADVLRPVPLHDAGLLTMPMDPMDALVARLDFSSLKPYDEIWKSPPEVIQFIKDTMMAPVKRLKTQSVWDDEPDVDYTNMPHRPRTPLLSHSSRIKTPRLGSQRVSETSFVDVLPPRVTVKVDEEQIPEQESIRLEDVMDLKLVVEADVHAGMMACHRSTPFLAPAGKARALSKHAECFLRSESPPYERKLATMSPPLFPRDLRRKERDVAPFTLQEHMESLPVPTVKPVKVENIDPDIADANMVIVGGWTAIASSERDTPSLSLGSSGADELEGNDSDLWRPSSSVGLPDAIEVLRCAKIDEPIFPREERFRGGSFKEVAATDENGTPDLHTFLSTYIPRNLKTGSKLLTVPVSEDSVLQRSSSPDRSMLGISMLGQPPSEFSPVFSANAMKSGSDALYVDLARLFKAQDPDTLSNIAKHQHIIMHEKLDEKEALFMDVPILSAPNAYLHKEQEGGLMALSKKASAQQHETAATHFKPLVVLQKVSGLKSLNLELSWRPFNFGSKVPTHQELLGIDSETMAKDHQASTRPDYPLSSEAEFTDGDESYTKNELTNYSEQLFLTESDAERACVVEPMRSPKERLFMLARSERQALAKQDHHSYLTCQPPTAGRQNHFDISSATTPDHSSRLLTPETIEDHNLILADDFHGNAEESVDEYEAGDLDDREWKRQKPSIPTDYLEHHDLGVTNTAHDTHLDPYPLTVNPQDLILTNATQSFAFPRLSFAEGQALMPALTGSSGQPSNESLRPESPINFKEHEPGTVTYFNDAPLQASADEVRSRQSINKTLPLKYEALGAATDMLDGRRFFDEFTTNESVSAFRTSGYGELQLLKTSLLCERQSLASFLQLRGKKSVAEKLTSHEIEESATVGNLKQSAEVETTYSFDEDARLSLLRDTRAFTIPNPWSHPLQEHAYLASLDLIQQRSLLRALESPRHPVRLVERGSLTARAALTSDASHVASAAIPTPHAQHAADISLIVAPDAGVIFFPLGALPSQTPRATLLAALARHSWRFARLLLVLLAFPRATLFRVDSANGKKREHDVKDGPCAYSPPVLKACRRLRRDIALREGTEEQCAGCTIELAFADNVEEAASLVRAFGVMALQEAIVDMAPYLGEEEQDGESDLATMEGMNAYCAAVILRCCTLNDFLEMNTEQRVQGFADLIGQERVEHVNQLLQSRIQTMDLDSDLMTSEFY